MDQVAPDNQLSESISAPLFLRQMSPEMLELIKQHFWCDFSDMIPAMRWDNKDAAN